MDDKTLDEIRLTVEALDPMVPQEGAAALLAVTKKEGTQIGRFKTIDVRWTQPLCE